MDLAENGSLESYLEKQSKPLGRKFDKISLKFPRVGRAYEDFEAIG